jgi:GABA(A) receptor-associated protein
MSFKSKHSFEERLNETRRILIKYPDRIPIICEKNGKSKETPDIDKHKYLVPYDLTIGQFIYVVRKRLSLPSEKALFFFINGFIPASSALLMDLYNSQKEADGFLYVSYSLENTFGKEI